MLCGPAVKLVIVSVATPFAFKVALPSCDEPSMNVTFPVGGAPVSEVTVAVSVRSAASPRVVVVVAFPTIWLSIDESLALKFASPLYDAEI
jgi:hypothetical protein